MRVTAMIVGILGGLIALEGTALTLGASGVGSVFGVAHSGQAFVLSSAALVFAVLGIIGAVVTLARPVLGGILMILAVIGGTVAITGAFLLGAIVLLAAGILAFMSARRAPSTPPVQPSTS